MDDVVAVIRKAGRGALLGKMDIKQAYRNVPISAVDRQYLGMQWEGQVFIDGVLPFGLRSAPLIFTALADAFEWVLKQEGTRWIFHYIDNFITIGEPDSEECALNMARIERISNELGLPIEEKKTEGPSACLTFLGIGYQGYGDTITRQQVNPVETSTIRLAGKEGSQEERTSVTDWHFISCLQSGQIRQNFPSLLNYLIHMGQAVGSFYQIKQVCQI